MAPCPLISVAWDQLLFSLTTTTTLPLSPAPYPHFFSSDRKLLSLSLPPPPPAPYPPLPPGLPPFFFPALIGNCYCYLPFCQLCDAGDRVTSGLDVLTWLPDNGMVTFETISNPTLSSFVIFFYNTFHPICSECKATLGADVQVGIIDLKLTHQLIDDKKFQPLRSFRLRLPKRGKIQQQQQQQQKETKKRVLNESKELNVLPIHNVFLFIISVFYC